MNPREAGKSLDSPVFGAIAVPRLQGRARESPRRRYRGLESLFMGQLHVEISPHNGLLCSFLSQNNDYSGDWLAHMRASAASLVPTKLNAWKEAAPESTGSMVKSRLYRLRTTGGGTLPLLDTRTSVRMQSIYYY